MILWDLDGTLVDSLDDIAFSANEAIVSLGLPRRSEEEMRGFVGEGARRLIERAVAPNVEIPGEAGVGSPGAGRLIDLALERFLELYSRHLLDRTRLYPGIEELLRSLKGPLAVATNKPGKFARRILQGLGVAELFLAVLGGDDGPRKPDAALVDRLRGLVAAPREKTVLVGDSWVDCETAKNAGVKFVGVAWGIGGRDEMARAGATTIVESVAELGRLLRA